MTRSPQGRAVQRHYDRLGLLYRLLWGDHLHHGYWAEGLEDGAPDSPARAQLRLNEQLATFAGFGALAGIDVRDALDVGCGTGGSSFWLAERVGCRVLGINISPVQLRIARQAAIGRRSEKKVRFARMDASRLTLPDRSFDLVWVVECSEHLEEKPAFFRQCFRVLRPGGTLALCSWICGPSEDDPELVRRVEEAMLLPSLVTHEQIEEALVASGFVGIRSRDATREVSPTWEHALRISRRPAIRSVARLLGPDVVRFVDAFELMRDGYASGALEYGMFTARKAP